MLHRARDAREVGSRIEKPYLGFHGEGMRAFLHDACALTVILTQYDQCAALDSRRRKVRKGVRGDIGADG